MDMLRQVKPTMFYGIPWVWDRLPDDLKTSQLALTPFQRKTDQCAMGLGLRVNKSRLSREGWGTGTHRGARPRCRQWESREMAGGSACGPPGP